MAKKYLALDYGDKFIGLASFEPEIDPFPLKYGRLENKGEKFIFSRLKDIIDNELITDVIVGVPYFTDGSESSNTKKIKKFIQSLTSFLGKNTTVHEQDETLTSNEAKDRMLNSPEFNFRVDLSQIDALSAQIILEDFMKTNKI